MAGFKKDYNSYFLSITLLLCGLATLSVVVGFLMKNVELSLVFFISSGLLVLVYFIMSCISIHKTRP